MAIDPKNPKKSKRELPKIKDLKRPAKAALDYGELVRMRELILQELIEDLGGTVVIGPELLTLVEIRLKNVIEAGLKKSNLTEFLE